MVFYFVFVAETYDCVRPRETMIWGWGLRMSSLEVTSFTRHRTSHQQAVITAGEKIFQGADLLHAPKYTCFTPIYLFDVSSYWYLTFRYYLFVIPVLTICYPCQFNV